MRAAGAMRASGLALLPQRRLNGSQRQNTRGRRPAMEAKSQWWEGKTQSFCEEENGKGFLPERGYLFSHSRGLGNEYTPFHRHPEGDREILLP